MLPRVAESCTHLGVRGGAQQLGSIGVPAAVAARRAVVPPPRAEAGHLAAHLRRRRARARRRRRQRHLVELVVAARRAARAAHLHRAQQRPARQQGGPAQGTDRESGHLCSVCARCAAIRMPPPGLQPSIRVTATPSGLRCANPCACVGPRGGKRNPLQTCFRRDNASWQPAHASGSWRATDSIAYGPQFRCGPTRPSQSPQTCARL